jgi:hypothetical protein
MALGVDDQKGVMQVSTSDQKCNIYIPALLAEWEWFLYSVNQGTIIVTDVFTCLHKALQSHTRGYVCAGEVSWVEKINTEFKSFHGHVSAGVAALWPVEVERDTVATYTFGSTGGLHSCAQQGLARLVPRSSVISESGPGHVLCL